MRVFVLSLLVTLALCASPLAQSGSSATGLSPATRTQLLASAKRGADFLRSQQQPDGTFDAHPGVTGMAAHALLLEPNVPKAQRVAGVQKTLDYVAALAKPDGGLYVSEKMIPHYITAVSVMTLAEAGRASDKAILEKARAYLAEHLLDESEGIGKDNKFYGGMGYGGTSNGGIADIISLEMGLRAMKDAGLPAEHEAWNKAISFLQRTQNFAETNDQAWAGKDGGFIYYPGYSQVSETTQSYGSATYAGVLSFTWANLKPNDRRVRSVLTWIRDNYTVEENPGIGTKALYYYYMVFAKALRVIGEPEVVDGKGQRHNWREDLTRKLLSLQQADGSWVNQDPREMQNNKVLVTSFTMMAIDALLN